MSMSIETKRLDRRARARGRADKLPARATEATEKLCDHGASQRPEESHQRDQESRPLDRRGGQGGATWARQADREDREKRVESRARSVEMKR
jgi:hypothetical protein